MAWRTYAQKLNDRYVDLSDLPNPNTEYSKTLSNLYGGLNIQKLDYELDDNESPSMQNLVWRDGVLSSRMGQAWMNTKKVGNEDVPIELGKTYGAFDSLWHDNLICHCGTKLYSYDIIKAEDGEEVEAKEICDGVPEIRGTFFLYNNKLYYKTIGSYIRLSASYTDNTWVFTSENVADTAYTPITIINASPLNGSGDTYQPENRLSSDMTIWYNALDSVTVSNSNTVSVSVEDTSFKIKIGLKQGEYTFTYDGSNWKLNDNIVYLSDYGITAGGTPVANDFIKVTYACTKEYHLPVVGKELVKVVVDGKELVSEVTDVSTTVASLIYVFNQATWRNKGLDSGTYVFEYNSDLEPSTEYPDKWTLDGNRVKLEDYGFTYSSSSEPKTGDTITVVYVKGEYYYDSSTGVVLFVEAPKVTFPTSNNTVQITYHSPNETAYNNIMDCRFAKVLGGTGSLCVVMAGSKTQPNAYFWNGQTTTDMDASYFPMEQYQLAGDTLDPITGFGIQQSYLIIFKQYSVGRASLDTEEIDERAYITLPYTPINDKIGCDLPWTIQLIENNLVWCNTEQGVHFLSNTTAAYENNILCISKKVNGSQLVNGVLNTVRRIGEDEVFSADDTRRYWLVCDGKVWLWDYEITDQKDPSWFYLTNINGRAFMVDNDDIYHLDNLGRLTHFIKSYTDYEGGIEKVYRFATQAFSSYDKLKNVNSVIINVRGDMDSSTELTYITDYEHRKDLTTLDTYCWHLVPRNLEYRDLSGSGFAATFRRRPYCRHVRHFTMELKNSEAGQNLSIVSAQIFYNFQGRQR